MKETYRVIRAATLLVVLAPFIFMQQVHGATGSIAVLPAYPDPKNERTNSIFVHTLKLEESVKDGLRVVNNTSETRTVNLGVVDAIASANGTFSCRQNSEKRQGVGKWVQLASSQVTLASGTSEVVDFTITAPKDATPGEHGGCITAQDTLSYGEKKKGGGVSLGMRYAVRIAVTTPGTIVKKLTIERVDIQQNEKGNYTVSTVAKNSGNVSLDVQARAQLVSVFGQKSPVKDKAKYPIMPGATTGWPYEFERPFWGGVYRARTSLAYNANPLDGLGQNTDKTQTSRGDTGYFVMMPAPKAIAVYVAGILVPLLVATWFVHRRLVHRRLGKKWQRYVVRSGDTLAELAAGHGVRWKKLAKINHIKAPFLLTKGQEILLPAGAATSKSSKSWATALSEPERPSREKRAAVIEDEDEDEYEYDDTPKTVPMHQAAKPKPVTNRMVYAPRPVEVPQKKKTSSKNIKGGYNWANPGSAWAPRVVSEDELDRIIQEKTARKTLGSKSKPKPRKNNRKV